MKRAALGLPVIALVVGAVLVVQLRTARAPLTVPVETIAPRPLVIEPSSGPAIGGTTIAISGRSFGPQTSVTIDGVAANGVKTQGTSVTAVVPEHALGAVDVVVTTSGETVTCTACYTYVAARTKVTFPLAVSADHRYLQDATGTPFRIQGDAAWSLIANLTFDEAATYLNDRQSKGFNAVLVNLLEWHFATAAPNDRQGDAPFRIPGSLATPNDRYFAFADSIIKLAASKGFSVFLAYMYLGSNPSEGWSSALGAAANTEAVAYDYGRYVGERFRDDPNIIWVAGGDLLPPAGSELERRTHNIMEGIKSVSGASRLHTAHWSAEHTSTDDAAFATDVDLNAAYTYRPTHAQVLDAYGHSPAIPTFLIETGYELEGWAPGDRASVRGYEYEALLSGIAGVFYGHRDIWEFATDTWSSGYPFGHQDWRRSLDAPGAQDMATLGRLGDALRWWELVPSGAAGRRAVVTAGGGTRGQPDFVAAAVSANGDALLAYVPPTTSGARSISIDMSALRAPVAARWFDPTTGSYRDIGAGLANTGVMAFRTPGLNAGSASDWVLVLEAAR